MSLLVWRNEPQNAVALPTVADSLAGRMETLSLRPCSQSEISGQTANWPDRVFADRLPNAGSSVRDDDLVARVLRGGYPEALTRSTDSFVCAELLKHASTPARQHASTPARQHASTSARQHVSTAEGDFQLLYDRDADQVEVDVVIENAASQVVGVEIKSSATVTSCTPPSLANTLASAIGWLM